MSDPVSALGGAVFHGFSTVREMGPVGMISLRVLPDAKGVAAAFDALGVDLPKVRRMTLGKGVSAAWMSPDEYLFVMDYAATDAAMAALDKALTGSHYLAVVVSDARAMFRVEGAQADQVLRKLAPVDIDRMEPLEVRRTRTAQVAAAFWQQDGGYTVVCFRSVAGYVMGLLSHSAMVGSGF